MLNGVDACSHGASLVALRETQALMYKSRERLRQTDGFPVRLHNEQEANILLKGFQIPGYKTFLALDFRENIIKVPKFSKTMGIHYRAAFAESSSSFSAHRRIEVWSRRHVQMQNLAPGGR